MARDIRAAASSAANGANNDEDEDTIIHALIVTIPSETVANAVRYVADRGMPVFGLNYSGYELVELVVYYFSLP